MDSDNIFGQRILELRKAAGLTQKQLGEIVGLSMQAINDIEKGRRETTFTKAILLARYFDTTVDYLIGETDNLERPPELPALEYPSGHEDLFNLSMRLKQLRISGKLTYQAVGKATQLGTLRYKNIEFGETSPTLEMLLALADYFDVSLDYLVGRTDKPEVNR